MLDGERSKTFTFWKKLHRDVGYNVIIFKVFIYDMIVAIGAAKQEVTVGKIYGVGVDVCR